MNTDDTSIPADDAPTDAMTDEALARMAPMPLAKRARVVTGLGRAAFCERYGIPLDGQTEWEQGRSAPPDVAASYLTAILHDHRAVAAAFNRAA